MDKRHREREKRMHHQQPDFGAADRPGLLGGAWVGSVRKQSTAVLAGAATARPCKQRGIADPIRNRLDISAGPRHSAASRKMSRISTAVLLTMEIKP